jgi:hypothetical protein
METYSLWNGEVDDGGVVRINVTAINVQQIGSATASFIQTILSDCGLPSKASGWSVSAPFATSYLSRGDDLGEWRDRWWITWEVRIELAIQQMVEPPDRVVDTFAFDESWTGEEKEPEAFVVVGVLSDHTDAIHTKEVLSRVLDAGVHGADNYFVPPTSDIVARMADILDLNTGPRARVSLGRSAGLVEVRIEPSRRKIEETATVADLVEELVRSLGARTRYVPG